MSVYCLSLGTSAPLTQRLVSNVSSMACHAVMVLAKLQLCVLQCQIIRLDDLVYILLGQPTDFGD